VKNIRTGLAVLSFFLFPLLLASPGLAHVPFLEYVDYSFDRPMEVPEPVAKSRAYYSWLETAEDVDVYAIEITGPSRIYAQALVPVCRGYEDVLPWFAVAGPGLPPPEEDLPFELPPGYGAWVVKNEAPWTPRKTFFEPFGNKWYFDGPLFDQEVEEPGRYYLYYWNPQGAPGDYVAVVGPEEIWEIPDILQAIVFTPMIRNGDELHLECKVCPFIDSRVLQDADGDGIGDMCDNCPERANPDQTDDDGDLYGQACDCADGNPAIHPGQPETGGDGVDSNCFPEGCSGGPVEPGSSCDNCFIATAAFGTEMAGKIDLLRAFRDRLLLTSMPGRKFVELYYRYSPPVARFIGSGEGRRTLVRLLLFPAVGLAYLFV